MTAGDHERFADWDASYVLGALAPAERKLYEAHLDDCAQCRTMVAELAAMPGLLSRIAPTTSESADGATGAHTEAPTDDAPVGHDVTRPPADMMDRMLRRERTSRSRRRLRVWIAAAAAVVLVAAGVGAGLLINHDSDPTPVALSTVVPGTNMTAEAGLKRVPWGTRISVECDYPKGSGWSQPERGATTGYALVLTNEHGEKDRVATWQGVPGHTAEISAATALRPEQIETLAVTDAHGRVLLRAKLHD